MRLVLWAVALVACRPEFEVVEGTVRGAAPIANAGTGTTVRANVPLALDGSRSVDPDGSITSYAWSLVSAPPTSSSAIVDAGSAIATFTPNVPGEYKLRLTVTDDDGQSDTSSVTYQVIQEPLFVSAGPDVSIEWRKTAQLGAVVGVESGETPVLAWNFVSKPSRSSAVILNASTLTPSFVADADGTYVLELTATTSMHQRSDTITVTAAAQRVPFDGAFVDAAFISWVDTNWLVAISDNPPRVRFIDPVTASETSISLPSAPTAMAVDQYVNNVAVVTSGQIHIINARQGTLTASHDVSFQIASLVFGPFGLIHCITPTGGPIQTLDLSNGVVSASAFSVPAGSVARVHSSSYVMYGIEATTPRDLAMYPANVSPATRYADSPYTGQYSMGDKLWIHGDTIVVSTGNVFASNPYNVADMTYRGALASLGAATIEYAYWHTPRIVTLQSLSTTEYLFRTHDSSSFAQVDSAPLPDIMVNGVPQPATGRLLAYSPSYPNKVVIVESAGMSNAFVVTDP